MPTPIGVMMLATGFRRLPGDIGHDESYPFPMLRRVVPGADVGAVVDRGAAGLVDAFVACGHALIAEGAQALTTSCGFLVLHQAELARRLPVPVLSSALLLAANAPGPVGILTFDAAALTAAHLAAAGLAADTPVEGLPPGGPVARWLREDQTDPNVAALEADVVAAAQRLLARHPEVHTIVLECTNLPPFGTAVAAATGRTLVDIGDGVRRLASLPTTSARSSRGGEQP